MGDSCLARFELPGAGGGHKLPSPDKCSTVDFVVFILLQMHICMLPLFVSLTGTHAAACHQTSPACPAGGAWWQPALLCGTCRPSKAAAILLTSAPPQQAVVTCFGMGCQAQRTRLAPAPSRSLRASAWQHRSCCSGPLAACSCRNSTPCGMQPPANLSLGLGPSEQAVWLITQERQLSSRPKGRRCCQGLMAGRFLSPIPSRDCLWAKHSRGHRSRGQAYSAGPMLTGLHQAD